MCAYNTKTNTKQIQTRNGNTNTKVIPVVCTLTLPPREPYGHQEDHQNSNHAEVAIFVMMTMILF